MQQAAADGGDGGRDSDPPRGTHDADVRSSTNMSTYIDNMHNMCTYIENTYTYIENTYTYIDCQDPSGTLNIYDTTDNRRSR
jgi:hypothetical protein